MPADSGLNTVYKLRRIYIQLFHFMSKDGELTPGFRVTENRPNVPSTGMIDPEVWMVDKTNLATTDFEIPTKMLPDTRSIYRVARTCGRWVPYADDPAPIYCAQCGAEVRPGHACAECGWQ